jgi:cytochrome c556
MTRTLLAAAAVAALLTSLPAAAQFQKPEQAIKYRQSAMTLQANHLGRVFAMAQGRVPFDAKVAQEQIDIVAMLNKIQFAGFVDGSDKGAPTRAKAEVWTDKEKFAAAVAKSQEATQQLVAAGRSGSLDQIKAAAGAVGQTCKGCHDTFQAAN